MLRFGLSLLIYISIGRWLYSEVELYAPRLKPLVDSGLEYITIPRSDTWSRQRVATIFQSFGSVFEHLTPGESEHVETKQIARVAQAETAPDSKLN